MIEHTHVEKTGNQPDTKRRQDGSNQSTDWGLEEVGDDLRCGCRSGKLLGDALL